MHYGIGGDVKSLSEQMDEMREIKKKYPKQILPFIAIDPNNPDAKKDFLNNVKTPALYNP